MNEREGETNQPTERPPVQLASFLLHCFVVTRAIEGCRHPNFWIFNLGFRLLRDAVEWCAK